MRLRTRKDVTYWIEVEDARVEVRPLSASEIMEIERKHTKRRFRQGQWIEERNDRKFAEEVWCRTVLNWENIFDEDGNPLPCTDENKKLVRDLNPEFALEVLERAREAGRVAQEAEEKN